MSKEDKLIQRFQTEPLPKDIDFADFKKYMELYGFRLDRTDGSHNMFVHDETGKMYPVSTVNGRQVKSYHVKNFNNLLKTMEVK